MTRAQAVDRVRAEPGAFEHHAHGPGAKLEVIIVHYDNDKIDFEFRAVKRGWRYSNDDVHKVLMAVADADLLTEGDTLLVTAGDTFVGHRHEVRSAGEASAGLGWVARVYIEKV